MNKLLKLTGVSVLAIMTATGARAAGYTCEELVVYESCNPGYYYGSEVSGTSTVCPGGYTMYTNGVCWEFGYESLSSYTTQTECEANAGDTSGEDYRWISGTVCVNGKVGEEGSSYTTELVEGDIYTDTCVLCPVGSICAGGDVADAVAEPCPAGSYCATKGLSAVSGVCAVGSYSTGGATACTSCPVSSLTDANGNVVSVTTASTGSTSSSACYVAKGTEFKDSKGTYKYTDNCAHGNYSLRLTCENYGGTWQDDDCDCGDDLYWRAEGEYGACIDDDTNQYIDDCHSDPDSLGWSWDTMECIY